jgi:hypothetical protein
VSLAFKPLKGPGVPALILHAAMAGGRVAVATVKREVVFTDDATVEARKAVCVKCEFYDPLSVRCVHRKCGCFLAGMGSGVTATRVWGKWKLATERCPLGKWPA